MRLSCSYKNPNHSPSSSPKMASFLFLSLLLIASSVNACERCVHKAKVSFFSHSSALSDGACGYGSMAMGFNHGHLAAAMPSIYKDGAACGACFQIRCKNSSMCSPGGTTVTITDVNRSNKTEFVLSSRALMAMSSKGMSRNILKHGIVEVEYKRVPCEYKNKNMAVRVQESSKKSKYLAVEFLYQGGQTQIVGVDIAQVGRWNWSFMTRSNGAVWETRRVPSGPLQFRLVVTSGYDGMWVWAKSVLPADWVAGGVYDSGVQITAIALEGCSPCDDDNWI